MRGLCQAAPGTTQPEPSIKIDGAALKNVEDITYLGSCLSSCGGLDTEISCRLSKASSAFGRLWTRAWRERGITQATKLAVYRAVVLIPNLVVWLRDVDTLPQTPQDSGPVPRPLPCISWEDRVTNQEVLRRSRMPGVEVLIMKAQLRWTGHVMRMRTAVFQNRPSALNWLEAIAGRGGQTKRYKDP